MSSVSIKRGFIALERKYDVQSIGDLSCYYWEFFDVAGYEHHLLSNHKLFRTVLSRSAYPDLHADNLIYQLELNRRLIDMAWLYLECLENQPDGESEPFPPHADDQPAFHYQFKSTYYFDTHADLKILWDDKRTEPFKKENGYKEVITRFKGKVTWLTLDESLHPHWLYQQVFENRTYSEWLELLDIWGEYTFLNRSICERLDGGEVFDTYVLFQKLTEMAYLMYTYGIRSAKYGFDPKGPKPDDG